MSHHLHNCVSHKMSLQSLLSVMNHFIHVIDMYGSIFVVETASLDISIVRSYELMNVTYRTSGHECQLNTILHKCSVILPRSSSVCVTVNVNIPDCRTGLALQRCLARHCESHPEIASWPQ